MQSIPKVIHANTYCNTMSYHVNAYQYIPQYISRYIPIHTMKPNTYQYSHITSLMWTWTFTLFWSTWSRAQRPDSPTCAGHDLIFFSNSVTFFSKWLVFSPNSGPGHAPIARPPAPVSCSLAYGTTPFGPVECKQLLLDVSCVSVHARCTTTHMAALAGAYTTRSE